MDFFQKLGDAITDAGMVASEKAKEVTEVTKLKCRIRKNETQIQSIYTEMGKAVYQSIMEQQPYPEFSGEIEKIEAAQADIQLCKDYIREIKDAE